jgi:hypothetical protein
MTSSAPGQEGEPMNDGLFDMNQVGVPKESTNSTEAD